MCLYIACRKEETPYLLIDFSDILKVNMYLLGSVYMKLVQKLNLQVPLIDPSLYIRRFCEELEFGSKQAEVTKTALRFL